VNGVLNRPERGKSRIRLHLADVLLLIIIVLFIVVLVDICGGYHWCN
jgi:hypothetical protein